MLMRGGCNDEKGHDSFVVFFSAAVRLLQPVFVLSTLCIPEPSDCKSCPIRITWVLIQNTLHSYTSSLAQILFTLLPCTFTDPMWV